MTIIEPTTAILRLRESVVPQPKPGRFTPQYAEPGQPDNVEHHTDGAHEALFKHDTAVAESHKAIIQGQAATSLEDRVAAKTRLIDAAKGHKHAARQITRLTDQLRTEPKRAGAAVTAKRLAAAHRDAASLLEESALGGSLLKARKAVGVADRQAKTLSATLGVRPKLPKPKPEEVEVESRIESSVLDTRDWTKWNLEHPYVHHPRGKKGKDEGTAHRPKGTKVGTPRAGKPGIDYPIKTTSVDEAARLLGEGKKVELNSPREVGTLLDKLAAIVHDATEKGEKAPIYDLCNVSVPHTNLFCADAVVKKRIEMPQLSGIPRPGSPADKLPKNKKGEVDLSDMFRRQLEMEGHKVTDTTESAAHLKASQHELIGNKVAGMVQSLRVGKLPPGRIFTSNDNYIVDGHHRWAANVGESLGSNKDMQMDIARIDMPIIDLLNEANKFTEQMGLEHQRTDKLELLIAELRERMETRDWTLWDEEHRVGRVGRLHHAAMKASRRLVEGTGSPKGFAGAKQAHMKAAEAFHAAGEEHRLKGEFDKAVAAHAVANAHSEIAAQLAAIPEDRVFDQHEVARLEKARRTVQAASDAYRVTRVVSRPRPAKRPPRVGVSIPRIHVTGLARPHHSLAPLREDDRVVASVASVRWESDADPLALAQVRAWLWEA